MATAGRLTHLLVVDVEATCDDAGRLPKTEMEMLEIGAVMTKWTDFTVVGELAAFVRPVRHPRLTAFCRQLTSITQRQVDDAPGFPEVASALKKWIYGFEDVSWCSWGDYDRAQLALDCDRHHVTNPMPHRHINLKARYSAANGLSKKLGMAQALKHAALPLVGTHHRGIDDARNLARLLPHAFGATSSGPVDR